MRGDEGEAERLLKQALDIAPGEPSLLNNLAGAYQLQGRDAEYRQLVQQLHKQHPEYFFGRVQMAGIYTQHGGLPAVAQCLEANLAQTPQGQRAGIREDETPYRIREDAIPF